MDGSSGVATGSGQRFGSSPHYQTLEEAVKHRTPIWLSKMLKTRFEDDVPLEDLFANCWVLGRVADAIFSYKDDKPYHCPPQNLGERPYKAIVQDIERFFLLCEILNIREDSRISLADVEQKRAGTQIGLCLWDIANSIQEKSGTEGFPASLKSSVPDFTECERYFGYRQGSVGTPDRWNLASKFETGGDSPAKFPKDSRHLVPSGLSGSEHDGDQSEEYDDAMDGPTQVLASILSPDKKKAAHSKVINAIMMTYGDDVEKEDAGDRKEERSPFPKIIDTNDGLVQVEKNRDKKAPSEKDMEHAKARHDELSKRRDGKESMLWHHVVIFASGAVVAAIGSVVCGVVADRKRKQRDLKMHGRW